MDRSSLNISLPRSLKDYVEEQVRASGYSTPSEYMRTLIREDQRRKAQEKLEAMLLEGLSSGEPIEVDREFWERKRRALIKQHKKSA
jgi:antitoxin ParD1/3/4